MIRITTEEILTFTHDYKIQTVFKHVPTSYVHCFDGHNMYSLMRVSIHEVEFWKAIDDPKFGGLHMVRDDI